jgi:hypothetical protein
MDSQIIILQTFLLSEKKYIDSLQSCIDYFIKPLKLNKQISLNELSIIFSNYEILYNYHQLMYESLFDTLSDYPIILLSFIYSLNMYYLYLSTYTQAINMLDQCTNNGAFLRWLHITKQKYQLTLMDLLVKPIHR